MKKLKIRNLEQMYNSDEFDRFIGNRLGNDLFINDPDRADRIHAAAEFGSDGSTHAEVIEDWESFLECISDRISKKAYETIVKEIDKCREWHEKNGSLFEEIG